MSLNLNKLKEAWNNFEPTKFLFYFISNFFILVLGLIVFYNLFPAYGGYIAEFEHNADNKHTEMYMSGDKIVFNEQQINYFNSKFEKFNETATCFRKVGESVEDIEDPAVYDKTPKGMNIRCPEEFNGYIHSHPPDGFLHYNTTDKYNIPEILNYRFFSGSPTLSSDDKDSTTENVCTYIARINFEDNPLAANCFERIGDTWYRYDLRIG